MREAIRKAISLHSSTQANTNKESVGGLAFTSHAETLPRTEHAVNEDVLLIHPELQLFGLFDGAGGHRHGQKAAHLASEVILRDLDSPIQNIEEGTFAVARSLEHANSAVYEEAQKNGTDMLTTAVVTKLWTPPESNPMVIVGSVGDSQTLLLHNDIIARVTPVDNTIYDLVRERMIESIFGIKTTDPHFEEQLDEEVRRVQSLFDTATSISEFKNDDYTIFLQRNKLKQALGLPTITPHISSFHTTKGDILLLVSDGITDNIDLNEINGIFRNSGDIKDLTHQLLTTAAQISKNSHSVRSQADDMSVVGIQF